MIGRSRLAVVLLAAGLVLPGVGVAPLRCQPLALPGVAGGWARAESVAVYAGKDLFLLVDGGADLFFEYGFLRAFSTEYAHPPDASAAAELYAMKDAAAAYGLFTSFTAGTGTIVPVGQEAVLGSGYCIFWKGPYVAMLTAGSVDSSSGPMLLQLAGALEKEIPAIGEVPDLCVKLRKNGFDTRSMVFIRGRLALGNHLPQAWASAFSPAEGVVGLSGADHYLVLEYANAAEAGAALSKATAVWSDKGITASREAAGRWTVQGRDGEVALLEQRGRHILAVSGREGRMEGLASLAGRILKAL
jgi:hypothetical protein